jgi:predicted PurR-regulated permease PerM
VHEHDVIARAAGPYVKAEAVNQNAPVDHAQRLERKGHRGALPKRTDALRFPKPWQNDRVEHEAALDRATAGLPAHTVIALDTDELRALSAVFSAPRWLRDLGIAAWLLVGVAGLLVGLTWILGLTSTITEPVLCALVVATVASPCVSWLSRHRVPRAAGALLVLLALVALGAVIVLLVVGGVKGESDQIAAQAHSASDKFASWLEDLGMNQSGATTASDDLNSSVPTVISTLVKGVAAGISGLTSLGFFLAFTIFSLFMLLKDGPKLRLWLDGHLGVPQTVAPTITRNVVLSIRRYFLGTTIVASFNAVVVGLGALILGVPLAGTIAVVTLVTAYIPFVGAFVSGAFAVVLALGSEGTTTALIMLVIVILANGALQNIVQPIAMGATLRMNPLLILVVTISAGAFFGMAGMVLAAPLTSAAIHISRDLARVRAASSGPPEQAAVPAPQ